MDLFENHQARLGFGVERTGLSNISLDLSVFLFIVEFQRVVCILLWLICLSYFNFSLIIIAKVILARATSDLRQIRSRSRYVRGERTYLCLQLNIKHLLFSVHINV